MNKSRHDFFAVLYKILCLYIIFFLLRFSEDVCILCLKENRPHELITYTQYSMIAGSCLNATVTSDFFQMNPLKQRNFLEL